jgi:tyrosine-protein kinase Etk/Wzc
LIESLFLTVQSRLKEAEIVAAIDDSRLRMLDSADTPDSPVRPVPDQYVKIGIFIGLLIGIALALLREMLDRSVHTQEDMQQMTASVSLGVIPHIRSSDAGAWRALVGLRSDAAGSPDSHASDRIVTVRDPGNPIAEAYRALRTNLTFARSDETPEVVVFTSPTPRDGKTTTTANLAIVLAYQRLRVLLIDADLRRGSVHRIFDIPSEPGLSNLLIGGTRVSDAVRTLEISTGITLDILPLGGTPPNPAELLGSDRMEQLISEFRKVYDIVIFDSPPVNLVTDAAILGAKADGVVLVGRANYTERAAVAFATDQLRQVRARMLGFVLNDFVFRRDYRYSSGGAYEYYDSDRYARRYANADGDDHVGRLPWWKRLLGRTAE